MMEVRLITSVTRERVVKDQGKMISNDLTFGEGDKQTAVSPKDDDRPGTERFQNERSRIMNDTVRNTCSLFDWNIVVC